MIGYHSGSLVTGGVLVSHLCLDVILHPCSLTCEQHWHVSGWVPTICVLLRVDMLRDSFVVVGWLRLMNLSLSRMNTTSSWTQSAFWISIWWMCPISWGSWAITSVYNPARCVEIAKYVATVADFSGLFDLEALILANFQISPFDFLFVDSFSSHSPVGFAPM